MRRDDRRNVRPDSERGLTLAPTPEYGPRDMSHAQDPRLILSLPKFFFVDNRLIGK
jgi:hypothetical protein